MYVASRADFDIRFVSPEIAKKYNLDVPEYEGLDQVVEIDSTGHRL